MKKVLFVATVVQKHINVFHLPFLKLFQNEGCRTYVAAANDTDSEDVTVPYCDEYVEIDFKRNPLHPGNISAYLKLKKLINSNEFDIIHCHTPVGGLLGRLAAIKARKKGTKVFYTAHGFHFYKGASFKNWFFYYPVEKFCSYFTDVLITINHDDFSLAKKRMKSKQVSYVPGVGVDISKFDITVNRNIKRREIGVPEDAIVLLSVGELNENKNHQIVVRALAKLDNSNIHYVIAGIGDKKDYLLNLAEELGVSKQLHLLGYRKDIAELNRSADLFCFPSFREGLSLSLMEAMASSLPVACSRIRGNTELIEANGGILFEPNSVDSCYRAVRDILAGNYRQMGENNKEKVQRFSIDNVVKEMKSIYES